MQNSDTPKGSGDFQTSQTGAVEGENQNVPQTNEANSTDMSQPPLQESQSPQSNDQMPELPVSPVVVTSTQRGIPAWFMVLFVISFVLFLAVTGLLIWTYQSRTTKVPVSEPEEKQVSAAPTQESLPAQTVAPTISSEDEVEEALRRTDTSDEINAISKDIEETDVSFLKTDKRELDSYFEVPTP